MTHALFLSAKEGEMSGSNEQLWQSLEVGNIFGPIFGFQNS